MHELSLYEIGKWAQFTPAGLTPKQKKAFESRRNAVRAVAAGASVTAAAERHDVNIKTLSETIKKARSPAPDRKPWGWRACIPHRVRNANTAAPDEYPAHAGPGAFNTFLRKSPEFQELLSNYAGPLPGRNAPSTRFESLFTRLRKWIIQTRTRQVKRYLRWAGESRIRRDAFGLELDPATWGDATTQLFNGKLPWHRPLISEAPILARSSIVRHEPNLSRETEQDEVLRIATDTGRAKDLFLELPVSFELPMRRVSSCVASKFQPSSFSERERFCLGIDGTSEYEEWEPRPSVILLRAYCVRDKLFFDGRILSRPVQTVLQQICLTMARHTQDQGRIDGYIRAYERILYRGYATAAYHALAKIEAPHTLPRSAGWKPVVFVRRRGHLSQLAFFWFGDAPLR